MLEQFVEVEPVMLSGRTLYLFPDGLAAQRAYLPLVEAMQRRTCCAVGRIIMSGRRYGVAVRPLQRLLAMHVLHDPALVRPAATLEADRGGWSSELFLRRQAEHSLCAPQSQHFHPSQETPPRRGFKAALSLERIHGRSSRR